MEAVSVSVRPVYSVVNNIPSFYHSAHLRRFFSQFIETNGFICFHFRHRPERQSAHKTSTLTNISVSGSAVELPNRLQPDDKPKTFCCIVKVSEIKFNELMRMYHQRFWLDDKGDSTGSKCLIARLKVKNSELLDVEVGERAARDGDPSSRCAASRYQTRGDRRQIPPDREEFSEDHLLKLPELRPPSVMPNGNVGTPTMHFLQLIQQCKLPPSIIKKLQLDFPKSKGKGRYGSVPFDYQTEVMEPGAGNCEDSLTASLTAGPSSSGEVDPRIEKDTELAECNYQNLSAAPMSETLDSCVSGSRQSPVQDAGSRCRDPADVDYRDNCTDDTPNSSSKHSSRAHPAEKTGEGPVLDYKEKRRLKKLEKQERKKLMSERIEEKMIEFEKAGSDSGDDNDTCQEWERHEAMYDDVTNQGRNKDRLFEEEMEVVWEKGGSGLVFYTDAQYWHEKEGDFDEQTADDLDVDMSAYYEDGAGDPDIRDFLAIRQEQRRRRGMEETDRFSAGIGKFEKHTKGFGRKILEKQGWTEGSGLGSTVKGISDALDNEGKHPKDRQGLGYRGEKLVRYAPPASRKRRREGEGLISTVYDHPAETDPMEPLHRRKDPSHIKHRNRIN